ncbi:hypothetical protein G3O06_07585 [Burkholderia sp. Ac-20345]|uniref:hypothetical protein n=1 Tax=Burkholderia sp. Ac-20345 TaxID=2703891 RepID=UPI00197C7BC8|nr:hypothetical protein [Burkholderia sp. Ac-20345]MBN3777412.1 hypothetical protein [Burkholderia sp. Ac-20345]
MRPQSLLLSRAGQILGGLVDREHAALTDAADHEASLEQDATDAVGVAEIAAALYALPESAHVRCVRACLDGDPREAGLVLIYAFNRAVDAEVARIRAADAQAIADSRSDV